MKSQVEDLKARLQTEIGKNKDLRQQLDSAENELRQKDSTISMLENKIKNYKSELKRVKFDIEQLNTQIADLRDKNSILNIDNKELEQ